MNPDTACPYRGLSAFLEKDKDLFFGREEFTQQLVEAVKKYPLVPVIGASGSGKSSVVLAGLIPRLRAEGTWLIESFRPQTQPFYELVSALVLACYPELKEEECKDDRKERVSTLFDQFERNRKLWQEVTDILKEHPGKRLLLVVDQFEELYALDKPTQKQFVDALLEAIQFNSNLKLVLTIRHEFLDYIINYLPFKEAALKPEGHKFLGTMNREEMKSVIELIDNSTQKKIVELEDGLTESILDDVQQEPGNLPLLEFALTRLWSENSGGILTHQTYEKIGGVRKALADHADEIYRKLDEEEKKQLQQIFVQLARPGQKMDVAEEEKKQRQPSFVGTDTRRLATRAEIGEDNWRLVQKLVGVDLNIKNEKKLPLLVTGRNENTGEQTVEVVHEALIREWGRLQEWIDNDRVFLAWRDQLRITIAQWNKDQGVLLRDKPLVIAEDWLQKREADLTNEREYIKQSLKLRKQEQEEQKCRRQFTIFGLTGFSVVALSLAGVAGWQWWQTEYQKQQVEKVQVSQSEALGNYSNALFNRDQQFDALIEALRAAKPLHSKPKPPMGIVTALRQAVYGVRERNRLVGHSYGIWSVSFSPDGKILASGGHDSTIKLWDVSTGKELTTLTGHKYPVYSVSFSPDGKTLASGSVAHTIKLWDVATGKEITTLKGHTDTDVDYVDSVSFSPDSKTLAYSGIANTIKLWNVATRKEITTLNGHKDKVDSVSFSPDGKILASGCFDKTIKLWDITTSKEITTLKGHNDTVSSVSFSPDGKTLASSSLDNTIKLWNVSTGKEITMLKGHSDRVRSVSFSPDGKTLASGSDDKTTKLWNVSTGKEIITLKGHNEIVISVRFSPDGKTLASGSHDTTIKLWDITTSKEISTLIGPNSWVGRFSFSPDNKKIAFTTDGRRIQLWDITTSKEITTLIGHIRQINIVSFSPNGKNIASGGRENTIKFWDVATGKEITTFKGHNAPVYSVSFSPDGKTLISGSDDKTIKLWDIATSKEITTFKGHNPAVYSINFSPDGKKIASVNDETIKLWDIATGKKITTLKGHSYSVSSVSFSADGKTLASGSQDQTIKLWDMATGKEITTLKGHNGGVHSLSFSADGKTLASCSGNTMKLWDIATHKEITTFKDHSPALSCSDIVNFSADGKTFAFIDSDRRVILWNLNFEDLLVRGCNWIRPYLQNNPNVSESDKHLCDGISIKK
ncbi:AAA family ATPase [Microcoleus sp. CAWBG58]|uniref:nSTAND1 domain-containing NTPase n=1 Tax=Microcoleus sp. CAWBG58 TaxID=2841651 RepID=UPI00345DC4EB